MADLLGIDRRKNKGNPLYQNLKEGNIPSAPAQLKKLLGQLEHKENGVLTDEHSSMFDRSRYRFFLEAPFKIASNCCNVMKKAPVHSYAKKTRRMPITAVMASESKMRTQKWLQNGCNGFNLKSPISNPMAFWTEQDVLLYIKEMIQPRLFKLCELTNNSHGSRRKKARKEWRKYGYSLTGIASVYGDIEIDWESYGHCKGQLSITEIIGNNGQLYELTSPPLKTTGCDRTGCMFCGFGCHLEKSPNRFERMKETHPKQYDYIMRPKEQGGLNYKEVIDWINEHGNMNIKY